MKNNFLGFRKSHTDFYLSLRNSKSNNNHNFIIEDNFVHQKTEDINTKFTILERKINELENLFIQRSKPTFDNNSIELMNHDIHALSTDITSRISLIKSDVKQKISSQNIEEIKILINIQQSQCIRLSYFVQRFRSIQASRRPEINFKDDTDDLISSIYSNFEPQLSHDQMTLLNRNQEELRNQNEELSNLISMMNDLNDLFRDVSLLIFEQGTILDRIDTKIQISINEIIKGNEQLEKANKTDQSNCYYIYLTSVLLLIIICIILIFLKK